MSKKQPTEPIQINTDLLRAAAEMAATHDVRVYLTGVRVRGQKDQVLYEATDGHRAFMAIDHLKSPGPEFEVWIPKKVAAKVRPINKRERYVELARLPEGLRNNWVLGDLAFDDENGPFKNFPSVAEVFPEKLSGDPGIFNPEYVRSVQRAFALANGGSRNAFNTITIPVPLLNGDGAGVFQPHQQPVGCTVVALIMPMKMPKEFALAREAYQTKVLPVVTQWKPADEQKEKEAA